MVTRCRHDKPRPVQFWINPRNYTMVNCYSNVDNQQKYLCNLVKRSNHEQTANVIAHLRIDGPYGSYGDSVFAFESVMLFGAGIGVTPMISILETLRHDFVHKIPICLKKVRFYWAVRHRSQVEWVREELSRCRRDLKGLLEIR